MNLSAEQQILLRRQLRAETPSAACACALWLTLGLLGAHCFYLRKTAKGAVLAILTLGGAGFALGGALYGGTFLDGALLTPSLSAVLRGAQSGLGRLMLGCGLALLLCALLLWLADLWSVIRSVRAARAQRRAMLLRLYQTYQSRHKVL